MKKNTLLISCLTLTASLPITGGISTAGASDFLGAFCWEMRVEDESATLKLAVTAMGGAHYLVNGIISDNDPQGGNGTVHGNAEISGNAVLLNLNDTGLDQDGTSNSSFAATLDPSTLNGSFKVISQDYYKGNMEPINYTEGTLTRIGCP